MVGNNFRESMTEKQNKNEWTQMTVHIFLCKQQKYSWGPGILKVHYWESLIKLKVMYKDTADGNVYFCGIWIMRFMILKMLLKPTSIHYSLFAG